MRLILACALLLCGSAHANMLQAIVGGNTTTPAVGYQGMGDAKSGALLSLGMRPYTAALAASHVTMGTLLRTSDAHECDVTSASDASLGNTTNCAFSGDNGTLAATWCAATTCVVNALIDQLGTGFKVTAQPGPNNAPTLNFTGLNGHAAMVGQGGGTDGTQMTTSPFTLGASTPQPLTFVHNAQLTGIGSGGSSLINSAVALSASVYYGTLTGVQPYAGTATNVTISSGVEHNIVSIFNGASSQVYVDNGSPTTIDPGTAGITAGGNYEFMGSPTAGIGVLSFTGPVGDLGIYPGIFSGGDVAAVCHVSFIWYGGTSC